jgi:hypothetical protein
LSHVDIPLENQVPIAGPAKQKSGIEMGCRSSPGQPKELKRVPQRELQVTLCRANGILLHNLSESAVVDARIWIAVANNIEGVERIKLKANKVLTEDPEVLHRRHIHVMKARTAH